MIVAILNTNITTLKGFPLYFLFIMQKGNKCYLKYNK